MQKSYLLAATAALALIMQTPLALAQNAPAAGALEGPHAFEHRVAAPGAEIHRDRALAGAQIVERGKVAAGEAAYAVARHGLLKPRDPDTVYHWLDRYSADGLDGLIAHRHGGNRRPPFRPRRPVGRPTAAGAG